MAAKKVTKKKKTTTRKKTGRSASPRAGGSGSGSGSAKGKHLVIVESPAKAKTINRYLGPEYVVRASVGHIRDLPSKNPKGMKAPVPGVDLEKNFDPTYEVLEGKNKTVTELRKLAKEASDVWFATDMDREGEAIAWHLAELLKISPEAAQRVVFNAITKDEIARAFQKPHTIDMDKVDAQQARRVLDRIVGYQVSPLLWKKVARGLSAGRVQSVAVRLVVEREREIRAHVPDESWAVKGRFTPDVKAAAKLVEAFAAFQDEKDAKGKGPTVKDRLRWLSEHNGIEAELIEVGGKAFKIGQKGKDAAAEPDDLSGEVIELARLAGIAEPQTTSARNDEGKGPEKWKRTVSGIVDPATPYAITSIETKRTTSRPRAPFITSTLQQAASSFLGFGARRTMQAAQRLYEGVEVRGEGSVGLITYMRTDATFIAPAALNAAREYVKRTYGDDYLPGKPNYYSSTNKAAQEAHECIRPTSLEYPPEKVKSALKSDEYRLYDLIWRRFVSCQMTPAQWDSTTALITGGTNAKTPVTFKATGRVLVFDGFYRVAGVPSAADEQHLPELQEKQAMAPFSLETEQKFSPPPPRFTEAGLIKKLEEEGIGRPSTYASIVQVIQDRKYVESIERRFFATDLGEVVTDKLIEAFPDIMELGYTREMEAELDRIESAHLDWRKVLGAFYGPFKERLEEAHESMTHAKAETRPAPYECADCGAATVYRFGKNGVFLSCSTYPACKYACPVDREGKPRVAEYVNVRCPATGRPMVRKTGRFGPFITTLLEKDEDPTSGIILNLDKKGHIKAPSPPPLLTQLECSKCGKPLALRDGVRGPWLGCSGFPKCRGRGKWAELDDATRARLEQELEAHMKKHPVQVIYTLDGRALTDGKGKPLPDAPTIEQLVIDDPAAIEATSGAA